MNGAAHTPTGAEHTAVADVFRLAAARSGSRRAARIVSDDHRFRREITYGELYEDGRRLAEFIRSHCGDGSARVGVFAPNCIEWLVVQCATALAGAALVPLNPRLPKADVDYVVGDAGIDILFFWPRYRSYDLGARVSSPGTEFGPRFLVSMDDSSSRTPSREDHVTPWRIALDGGTVEMGAGREGHPGEIALILYTSGSSGQPKAVALTAAALAKNSADMMARWEVEEGEVWCTPAPYFHIVGASMMNLGCASIGAGQVSFPWFDAETILSVLESGAANYLQTVPTTLRALLELSRESGRRPSGLRFIEIGGAPVAPGLQQAVAELWQTPLLNCYGLTETAGVLTQVAPSDPLEKQVATVGRAVRDVRLRVVDADGQELGPDQPGELQSYGYARMAEYLGKPTETAKAFTADGWLRTGDLATIDAEGFVAITGRLGEMIKRGAERIEPAEVEVLLRRHPAVADVAVFGLPDAYWGEAVCAAVVVSTGHTLSADDLSAWARANIMSHLAPSRYFFVDAIPVTESGKVRRTLLRRELESSPS